MASLDSDDEMQWPACHYCELRDRHVRAWLWRGVWLWLHCWCVPWGARETGR